MSDYYSLNATNITTMACKNGNRTGLSKSTMNSLGLLYLAIICSISVTCTNPQNVPVPPEPPDDRDTTSIGLHFTEEPHDVILTRTGPGTILPCSVAADWELDDSMADDTEAAAAAIINLSWRHDGVIVTSDRRRYVMNNGSLYFKQGSSRKGVGRQYAGHYVCVAASVIGTIVSRRARVQIEELGQFMEQPKDVEVVEGRTAWFHCSIDGVPTPSITWEKDKEYLPAQSSTRFAQLARDGGAVLQLFNVTTADSGAYRCRATNSARERSSVEANLSVTTPSTGGGGSTTSVEVGVPPARSSSAPTLLVDPFELRALRGSTILLQCAVMHTPPTGPGSQGVTWSRKDGQPLPVNRTRRVGFGGLEIRNVSLSDDQIYKCGLSGVDSTVFAESELTVLVPPFPLTAVDTVLVHQTAHIVRLSCDYGGHPAPTISWFKDGVEVKHNGRVKLSGGTLTILQSTDSDTGFYQCWAENAAGRAGHTMRLYIQPSDDAPVTPTGVIARPVSSRSIAVTWDRAPPSERGLQTMAYSVHYLPTNGGPELQEVVQDTSTVINALQPYTNYTIYVVAYNERSASRHSKHVTQMTYDDVPVSAPIPRLSAINSTSLLVQWEPLLPDSARGTITRQRIVYRRHNDTASERTIDISGTTKEYVLTGLISLHKYEVRILCATTAGFPSLPNERWPWVSFVLPNTDYPIGVSDPSNVELFLINGSTCRLSWVRPVSYTQDLVGFKVTYYAEGSRGVPKLDILVDHITEHIIYGLLPNTVYIVEICSFTDIGDGNAVRRTVTTPRAGAYPGSLPLPPTNIRIQTLNETAVRLSWTDVMSSACGTGPQCITRYTVHYELIREDSESSSGNSRGNLTVLATSENGRAVSQAIVSDLEPSASYKFSIQGHTTDLDGPISSGVIGHTLEGYPDGPHAIRCFLKGPTEVQLNWVAPTNSKGRIINFIVLYTDNKMADNGLWAEQSANGSASFAVVSGLKERTVYMLKVQAVTRAGRGAFSNTLEILTKDYQPLTKDYQPLTKDYQHYTTPIDGTASPPLIDNDRAMGIIIGVCIIVVCLIICLIIILLKKRCCPERAARDMARSMLPVKVNVNTNGRVIISSRILPPQAGPAAYTAPLMTTTSPRETTTLTSSDREAAAIPMLNHYHNPEHSDTKGGEKQIESILLLNGCNGYINRNGCIGRGAYPRKLQQIHQLQQFQELQQQQDRHVANQQQNEQSEIEELQKDQPEPGQLENASSRSFLKLSVDCNTPRLLTLDNNDDVEVTNHTVVTSSVAAV